MPTYSYACTACEHRFDAQQAFTDDALTDCPRCGGRLRKLFGNVGVVFKGSGFYRNDARTGAGASRKGGGSSGSATSGGTSGSSGSGGGGETSAASSSTASSGDSSGSGGSGGSSGSAGSTSAGSSSSTGASAGA